MSLHLIRFMLMDYSRSHRYFAPLVLYIITIALIYAYKPNPILSTYSLTATILHYFACWFGFSFSYAEDTVQQQLTILHYGRITQYYILKVVSISVIVVILGMFSIGYPIVFGLFDEPMDGMKLMIAIASHIGLAVLGVAISVFCNPQLFKKATSSLGFLFFICVVSLAIEGIVDRFLPGAQVLVWIVPPLFQTIDAIFSVDRHTTAELVMILAWPYLYAAMLVALFVRMMKKKLF